MTPCAFTARATGTSRRPSSPGPSLRQPSGASTLSCSRRVRGATRVGALCGADWPAWCRAQARARTWSSGTRSAARSRPRSRSSRPRSGASPRASPRRVGCVDASDFVSPRPLSCLTCHRCQECYVVFCFRDRGASYVVMSPARVFHSLACVCACARVHLQLRVR